MSCVENTKCNKVEFHTFVWRWREVKVVSLSGNRFHNVSKVSSVRSSIKVAAKIEERKR